MTYQHTENFTIYDDSGARGAEVTSDNDLQTTARLRDGDGNPILAATPLPVSTNPRRGKYFSKHLTNGSTFNMAIDGSGTPELFRLTPPSGKIYYAYRIIIAIKDSSINFLKFGGLPMPLTNGIDINVKEHGTISALTEEPIKDNGDFMELAYDSKIDSAAIDILTTRWSFYKAGTIFELKNSTGDYLEFVINDNLEGIDYFDCLVQGYEVDE